MATLFRSTAALLLAASLPAAQETRPAPPPAPGVVCQIRVISDKVPDVSTLEAWKKSFIKDGMSDEEKAMAVWKTVAMFQHQDAGVMEYLHNEDMLTDAMKVIHVYGHSYCGMAAAHVIELARYVGLEARGWTINAHVVPEIKWGGSWHLLDASLILYFPKADKNVAGIEEVVAGVKDWYAKNPEYWDGKHGIDEKLRKLQASDGWNGWKKGPEILSRCPTYDRMGWVPAMSHGWYSQMEEYDGTAGNGPPFPYEMGYSQGYRLNLQLRKGERLIRNWSHRGLCLENRPGCMDVKGLEGPLAYSARMFGDLSNGRIGNGTLEYAVPLATGEFRRGGAGGGESRLARRRPLRARGPRPEPVQGRRADPPHAEQLRLPHRGGVARGGRRARRGNPGAVQRQQRDGLEGRPDADRVRRPDDRPQASRVSPIRLPAEVRPEGQGDGAGVPEDRP